MNKKGKPKIIINKNPESVGGFEEFIEEYYQEVEESTNLREKPGNKNQRYDDFEVLNFLDYEYKRLDKINLVFTKKIPNYVDHPQVEALSNIQDKKLILAQKEITKILIKDNSVLTQNLTRLFKKML